MLGWTKKPKSIFKLISNKNQSIKPKTKNEVIMRKTTIMYISAILKNIQNQKQMVNLRWTTFQRLPFDEMFKKVDFFTKKIDLFDLRRHLGF
jgi:hypothetical protein